MNVEVNYSAVLLAAIASMIVGFFWYGPLFGKPWMKLKGYTKESIKKEQAKMGMYYGISFVLALLVAYVLTHVMAMSQNFYHYEPLTTGIISAFWTWLGFVMPVQTSATIFGDKKWNLLAIDTGHQLASLLAIGIILGVLA